MPPKRTSSRLSRSTISSSPAPTLPPPLPRRERRFRLLLRSRRPPLRSPAPAPPGPLRRSQIGRLFASLPLIQRRSQHQGPRPRRQQARRQNPPRRLPHALPSTARWAIADRQRVAHSSALNLRVGSPPSPTFPASVGFDPLRTLGVCSIVHTMRQQPDLDGLEAARRMAALSPENVRFLPQPTTDIPVLQRRSCGRARPMVGHLCRFRTANAIKRAGDAGPSLPSSLGEGLGVGRRQQTPRWRRSPTPRSPPLKERGSEPCANSLRHDPDLREADVLHACARYARTRVTVTIKTIRR